MVQTTLNLFDLIVFGVLGMSALLSFFRGFVREVFSLGAWIGATLITLYSFPAVAELLKPHVKSEAVANGFAGLFTFMGALIIITVLSSLLMKFFKSGNDVGLLDNVMGLVFGFLRGALFVGVAFYLFSLVVGKEENYPQWAKEAVSFPYVKAAAAYISKVAPEYIQEITPADESDKAIDDAVDDAKERTEELKDHIDKEWPDMDDLKERIENATDEPVGGGY